MPSEELMNHPPVSDAPSEPLIPPRQVGYESPITQPLSPRIPAPANPAMAPSNQYTHEQAVLISSNHEFAREGLDKGTDGDRHRYASRVAEILGQPYDQTKEAQQHFINKSDQIVASMHHTLTNVMGDSIRPGESVGEAISRAAKQQKIALQHAADMKTLPAKSAQNILVHHSRHQQKIISDAQFATHVAKALNAPLTKKGVPDMISRGKAIVNDLQGQKLIVKNELDTDFGKTRTPDELESAVDLHRSYARGKINRDEAADRAAHIHGFRAPVSPAERQLILDHQSNIVNAHPILNRLSMSNATQDEDVTTPQTRPRGLTFQELQSNDADTIQRAVNSPSMGDETSPLLGDETVLRNGIDDDTRRRLNLHRIRYHDQNISSERAKLLINDHLINQKNMADDAIALRRIYLSGEFPTPAMKAQTVITHFNRRDPREILSKYKEVNQIGDRNLLSQRRAYNPLDLISKEFLANIHSRKTEKSLQELEDDVDTAHAAERQQYSGVLGESKPSQPLGRRLFDEASAMFDSTKRFFGFGKKAIDIPETNTKLPTKPGAKVPINIPGTEERPRALIDSTDAIKKGGVAAHQAAAVRQAVRPAGRPAQVVEPGVEEVGEEEPHAEEPNAEEPNPDEVLGGVGEGDIDLRNDLPADLGIPGRPAAANGHVIPPGADVRAAHGRNAPPPAEPEPEAPLTTQERLWQQQNRLQRYFNYLQLGNIVTSVGQLIEQGVLGKEQLDQQRDENEKERRNQLLMAGEAANAELAAASLNVPGGRSTWVGGVGDLTPSNRGALGDGQTSAGDQRLPSTYRAPRRRVPKRKQAYGHTVTFRDTHPSKKKKT